MGEHSRLYLRVISDGLHRQLGLPRAEDEQLDSLFQEEFAQPLILTNARGRVWLDPLYAAFQLKEEEPIYVYLTRAHIEEEVQAYRICSNLRGCLLELPEGVARQFSKALRSMRENRTDVWMAQGRYDSMPLSSAVC